MPHAYSLSGRTFRRPASADFRALPNHLSRYHPRMQLDIFEHSREVMLRNAAVEELRRRDAEAAVSAIAALRAENPAEPLLPALGRLCAALRLAIPRDPERAGAAALLDDIEGPVADAARQALGGGVTEWLAPLRVELATAIAGFDFDPAAENLHPAPLLLRAGRTADAIAAVETIPTWRRRPAPLAWLVESRAGEGFAVVWPMLAELAWMAPKRARALAAGLGLTELDRLIHDFDAGFEGDGTANDFACFPAWALLVDRSLAAGLTTAQEGALTPAESCARLVLRLLALERRGRHDDLIAGRAKLRAAHSALFARYMRDR